MSGFLVLVVFLWALGHNYRVKLMQNGQTRRYLAVGSLLMLGALLLGVLLLSASFFSLSVSAESSSSSKNYQMVEGQFGIGSSDDSCSGDYCSKTTIGELGATSSETTASFGTAKYSEPVLQMIVSSETSDLGILTTEKTATKTMSVKIRNYLSGGYTLQIVGDSPVYNGHHLDTPKTPTASQPGTEQFGINVVANTTPAVGANPVQDTDGDDVFGKVMAGYDEANMFMYQSGDAVAKSVSNTGGTDYVISMVVNISSSTLSGRYSGDFSAILIPSY